MSFEVQVCIFFTSAVLVVFQNNEVNEQLQEEVNLEVGIAFIQ